MTTKGTTLRLVNLLRELPKRLWPISHLTILLTAFAVVFCASASALVIQHINQKPVLKPSSNITHYTDGDTICVSGQPNCPLPSNTSTPTQSTTPQSASTQSISSPTQPDNSTNQKTTTELGSTLDQYGCVTNTQSYSQCVKNAKATWCISENSEPELVFSNAILQARMAYFTVMNEWETAQYVTPHNPKSEYLADATSKFNAIYEPAYSTYYAQVQSLNSQVCSLKYPSHESAGQYQ